MLLERENELALLGGLLDDVGTAGGKVVLIRGEAGIGKSSLVRGFLSSVADTAHAHVGYCDDLQTPQPFGPLWDISRDDARLDESLRASNRQAALQAFFEILTPLLRPNVVVIEDTHWSDEATLDAIKYAGRRIARTNGLLVLTYRDEEVDLDNPLRTVLGALPSENVARIELGGLSKAAVAEIIAESGLGADEVLEATHGNPFFVTEMALTVGDEVPSSVSDSVMARVGRLSILAREMLRFMSVIPERTSRAELDALMGNVESQLAECERLGLLDAGAETVAFQHELIRRTIEASLTTSETIAIHRALLEVLSEDSDPARLVHHARGANDVDLMLELVPRAARAAAAVGGHREASSHYRSLEPHLKRLTGEEQARLLAHWALMEYYLGHEESVQLLERSIHLNRQLDNRHDLANALELAMTVHETHGHASAARQYGEEAIELLREDGPPVDLASALSRYAYLLIHIGEGRPADRAVEESLVLAQEHGHEQARLRALAVKGQLAVVRGQPGGLGLVEQVRQEAEAGGYRFEEAKALRNLAYIALEISDLAMEEDVARRAKETAIRYELPTIEVEADSIYADALMRKGDWAAAEELAMARLGSQINTDLHLKRVLGLLRLRMGRPGAREFLEDAWSIAERYQEVDFFLHVGACLAEQMWITGRSEAPLTTRLLALVEHGIYMEFPWPAGWLAFWLWRLESLDEAPVGVPEPYALAIRGEVSEAAGVWEARRMPYRRAAVLSCGDTSQQLDSLEILESLGAEAVAAKVRKDLRDQGVAVPRGKGRVTRKHAAGLTARQAEVLELLAERLSNPEIADRLFLSPRTVENHVSAVLAKLDSTTREEAVERARSRGLL